MFDRVDPPLAENKQIELAVRYILPWYQIVFASYQFGTWVQLERTAAKLERTYINARNYKAPPSFEDSMLPQLAFHDPNFAPIHRKEDNFEENIYSEMNDDFDDFLKIQIFEIKPMTVVIVVEKLATCAKPRRIFCRDCGSRGVRRTECQTSPPLKQTEYSNKKCGLVGVTTEKCTECSGNP